MFEIPKGDGSIILVDIDVRNTRFFFQFFIFALLFRTYLYLMLLPVHLFGKYEKHLIPFSFFLSLVSFVSYVSPSSHEPFYASLCTFAPHLPRVLAQPQPPRARPQVTPRTCNLSQWLRFTSGRCRCDRGPPSGDPLVWQVIARGPACLVLLI